MSPLLWVNELRTACSRLDKTGGKPSPFEPEVSIQPLGTLRQDTPDGGHLLQGAERQADLAAGPL